MFFKIAFLVVFFAVMVGIGIYCRRNATDVNGFVLGGRNVGPWLTAFAFGTSYFSAVIFVGYAGQFGWKYGIAAAWIGIGNAVLGSFMAWAFLGRRTRIMTQHLDSATMPQFFEKRFSSPALKIASSAIIFIFMIPYTASLFNGLSRLFEMAFGIDYSICVIVMAVLTGIYVVAGGYMATAINDFIQGIVMIIGIIAVVGAVLASQGGLVSAMSSLAEITDPSTTMKGAFASFFGPDPLNLFGVIILTSLGTWGLPQMVGKFYAISSEGAVNKGKTISTVFAIIVAGGCYFLGGFGRLFATSEQVAEFGYDFIIPNLLSTLPDVLIGVVIVLVLSASMSTLSSLVLASSSTLTLDFIKGTFVKDMKEKTQVLLMRILIVVFIAISVVIAIIQYRGGIAFIAQMMGISWGAMAGAFLAPYLYGLYWKKVSKISVWVNFAFSLVVMLLCVLAPQTLPAILRSPINAGAFCMIAGLIIVPVVSLFTPKPDKELVDGCFACYTKKVLVEQRSSLGEEEEVVNA